MIFTAKAQSVDATNRGNFERALARWKNIWDRGEKETIGRQSGFMVHAEEVWLLAHKFLKSDLTTLVSQFGTDDMSQARRWLTELDEEHV
jgi:hypothetical protein